MRQRPNITQLRDRVGSSSSTRNSTNVSGDSNGNGKTRHFDDMQVTCETATSNNTSTSSDASIISSTPTATTTTTTATTTISISNDDNKTIDNSMDYFNSPVPSSAAHRLFSPSYQVDNSTTTNNNNNDDDNDILTAYGITIDNKTNNLCDNNDSIINDDNDSIINDDNDSIISDDNDSIINDNNGSVINNNNGSVIINNNGSVINNNNGSVDNSIIHSDNLVILPSKVIDIDYNEVTITYDIPVNDTNDSGSINKELFLEDNTVVIIATNHEDNNVIITTTNHEDNTVILTTNHIDNTVVILTANHEDTTITTNHKDESPLKHSDITRTNASSFESTLVSYYNINNYYPNYGDVVWIKTQRNERYLASMYM